jgi:hypothetical protein
MRGCLSRALAMLVLLSCGPFVVPVQAQTPDELRREIETLRRDMALAAQAYERRLKELSDRLQGLEGARPPQQVPDPPGPPAAPPAPSLADFARPRQPFALATSGSGLLFDLGVSGDFVADVTSATRERRRDGTFAGRENRLFPREVSLGVFGRVDPYASAVLKITAGETSDEPRGAGVRLDEAYLSLLALPLGTTARLGVMRPRFGTLNVVHDDDLPQVDRPQVLTRFFGESQLEGERGVEAFWVLPLSIYHELAVGVFDGDNEVAFGRGSLRDPLVTARWRMFFELEDAGGVQIDVSAASGVTAAHDRNTIIGLGAKYKWSAPGVGFPVFTLAGEALAGIRPVVDETTGASERWTRWGTYLYGQYDFGRRWAAGLRGDWTELASARGREWAVSPYVQFKPSEFLRFRLQYKHAEGTGVVQRVADEILLQGSFVLGAHPTERF